MLIRSFEKNINIIVNRKGIQFKERYFRNLFDTLAQQTRALIILIFVKTKLNEKSVKGFYITLTMKLNKEKRLTMIDAMILNNCFEVKEADIEMLKKMFASLNT